MSMVVESVFVPTVLYITCINNFINGAGHLTLQQGVEKFNQHYQTAAKHQQGAGQEDQTYGQV